MDMEVRDEFECLKGVAACENAPANAGSGLSFQASDEFLCIQAAFWPVTLDARQTHQMGLVSMLLMIDNCD